MQEDSIDVEVLGECGLVLATVPVVFEPLTRLIMGNAIAGQSGLATHFKVGDAVFSFDLPFTVCGAGIVRLSVTLLGQRGTRLAGATAWKQLKMIDAMKHGAGCPPAR